MMRIKLFLGTAFLLVAMLVASAAPAFATGSSDGGDDGGDCNSTNSNAQGANINLVGNQTQGSCNDSNVGVNVGLL